MSGYTVFFTCVICERDIGGWGGNRGADKQVEPICRYCESDYTRGVGKPQAGTFADRHKTMQVAALAEALRSRALDMQWEARHGRP